MKERKVSRAKEMSFYVAKMAYSCGRTRRAPWLSLARSLPRSPFSSYKKLKGRFRALIRNPQNPNPEITTEYAWANVVVLLCWVSPCERLTIHVSPT